MPTRVVHIRKEKCDVYIGRKDVGMHFGNPFTHLEHTCTKTERVTSREEAISEFERWIMGTKHESLEPERRQWILNNLYTLKDKIIGCYCHPKSCHGDVLAKMADAL